MEFKIWGRLDENGRIQSIQSNCSGVQHDLGSLPYSCSDSLLTVNEKKKLVYQLDAKTDEMSVLILQLSEMSKRITLQEKLLSEYETKFKRQQRELEQLRRENMLLGNKGTPENVPRLETGSSEPQDFCQPVTTFEMTCNLRCRPVKYSSCPTILTNSFEGTDQSFSSGSYSTQSSSSGCESIPSTESSSKSPPISLDTVDGNFENQSTSENVANNLVSNNAFGETGEFSVPPKVSFDVSDTCNQTDESKLQSWDGYVVAANDGKLVCPTANVATNNDIPYVKITNDGDIQPDVKSSDVGDIRLDKNSTQISHDAKSSLFPPAPHSISSGSGGSSDSPETDKDGYLILDQPQVRQIAQEEIHGTWLSVNLKIQQSQYRTLSGVDSVDGIRSADRTVESEKDVCTTDEKPKEEHMTGRSRHMHKKTPSRNEAYSSRREHTGYPETINATDNNKRSWNQQARIGCKYLSGNNLPRIKLIRGKLFPDRHHCYAEIDESKMDPVFMFKRKSEPVNLFEPSKEEKRSLSSDRSEDDMCNSYIKTMKTTMEWAKAKKGLLKESNEMTVEKVESVLRDTVQEIYSTLQRYESEKPYRMNKPVGEKAAAVQRKLKHSRVVDIVSDDFLRKCVLVCSSKVP